MIDWRLYQLGNACRIEITVSWDLVGRLMEVAPHLLADLTAVLNDHQGEEVRRVENVRRTETKCADNRRAFLRMGRIAYSRLRHERNPRANDVAGDRRRALNRVAGDLGQTADLLELFIRLHRRQLEARIQKARLDRVERLLAQGASNAAIAESLRVSPSSVPRLVKKAREQMRHRLPTPARKGGAA